MSLVPSRVLPATPWAGRRADEDYGASARPDWREIDWSGHVHSIEVAGRKVNYAELGPADSAGGPPLVFVHGLGGAWQNWLENLPRVGLERRALALDLPGFGASDMPSGEISIPGYGRCVDEFCERLGLGEIALVGNSMGGFVAAEVAIQRPRRVERLVLVSAAGISITHLSKRPAQTWGRVAAAVGTYGAANSRAAVIRPGLRHLSLGFVARHPSRLRADLCWEQIHASGSDGFRPALDALMDYDFRDRLGEISCPTLLVWGKQDLLVPVRDADEFERRIPNARKVLMDDTGHVPMLERPATFNDLLMDFLAEPRGAPRSEASTTV